MAQRVAVAIALAGDPALLIADEPTTALDVTVQAEILQLLADLRRRSDMAIVVITHDWGVLADVCDDAVVMYAGEIVESADVPTIFGGSRHPYTRALIAADASNVPRHATLPAIPGQVPSPAAWPRGCRFAPRCALAGPECRQDPIPLVAAGAEAAHSSRCVHSEQLAIA
jgi:peptide/nickel transport system permease protein